MAEGSSQGLVRTCVSCGRQISFDANVCPYCGHDYRMPAYGMVQPRSKSLMPVVGGVLIIIAGLLAIVMGAFYLSMDPQDVVDSGATLPPEISEEDIANVLGICGALCLVFGVIALIGGYFGVMRKHFAFGIIGGIFGLLGLGFLIGGLLGLIGLILVAISRREFE